jgi:murein DD-endopeptidase MepM/ murein hydrolase activator NlpD
VDEAHYTLIVVPDARSVSRKIRVSVKLVRTLAGAAGASVLGLLGVLTHYAWLNCQVSELGALRLENAALSERANRQGESLEQLAGRIARLQSTIKKLGVMSGLDQTLPAADGAVGGVGGVTGMDAGPPSRDPEVVLHALSRRLSTLAERSERIESFYADQTVLLSHTPSVWPVRGYLSSGFGRRIDPFTGGSDYHAGIDVSAPRGTKVVAPADGVVLAVGRRGAYGNAMIIDHGYDVITRYGHLEGFNVRAGQRVRRGDVIGFVGSTGRSNAPHLHYEVWLADKAQDPIHYIVEEYRSFL